MAQPILNALLNHFSPAVVEQLSQAHNERLTHVQQAIDGLIPIVMAGIVNRTRDAEGARRVYRTVKSATYTTNTRFDELIGDQPQKMQAENAGRTFLKGLYDKRIYHVADEAAYYSGVHAASASALMGLIASVTLGLLRSRVRVGNLTESQLTSLLQLEAEAVRPAVSAKTTATLGWFLGFGGNAPYHADHQGETSRVKSPAEGEGHESASAGSGFWRLFGWGAGVVVVISLLGTLRQGVVATYPIGLPGSKKGGHTRPAATYSRAVGTTDPVVRSVTFLNM